MDLLSYCRNEGERIMDRDQSKPNSDDLPGTSKDPKPSKVSSDKSSQDKSRKDQGTSGSGSGGQSLGSGNDSSRSDQQKRS
jgi:hypothetical protein